MKQIIKIITMMLLINNLVYAAPARGGVRTFEQPDGTTFSGVLKGDAAFHWIESDAALVVFNPKDKFYYNAKIAEDGTIELIGRKMNKKMKNASALNSKAGTKVHTVSASTHKALMKRVRESRKGNYPR